MTKARILVVEDSGEQARLTKEFLEKGGHEVILAGTGTAALKTITTIPVDLVLLDFNLPDITGNEICRWLKRNEQTKGIPIIMLTVKREIEDKVSAIEAGADEYLPKPYNEIELNATIHAALRTKALQDELRKSNRQLEDLLEKVRMLAITDPLTGLYNRRYVESVLDQELKEKKRYQKSITCLMIDVDHFKRINDQYGHEVGDSVLTGIGVLLKQPLREVDIVARWGGEEFVVIMPHTDLSKAMIPATRILEAISGGKFQHIPEEHITVSIGVAHVSQKRDTVDKLINAADHALYEAKRNGRNRIEVATDEEVRG